MACATLGQDQEPRLFTGLLENDLLYNPAPGKHQDRHYTQGMKVIYLDRGHPIPGWADALGFDTLAGAWPSLWLNPTAENFGALFGQNIYTPENRSETNLITGDRPYAGWLYIGAAIQRRGESPWGWPVLENFELNLGIIGPEAQGEWAQNTVHQFRHLPTFDGWDNQLKTEPALVFKYGRVWKWTFNEKSSRYFDALPHCGVNLGTTMTSAEIGFTVRLGWNLPGDFGVQPIDSPLLLSPRSDRTRLGFYVFGRMEGRAVGRNAFLDGNLFRASHHVDKEPLVAGLSYGAAVTLCPNCELSWTFLTRTAEFEGQKGFDQFGSVSAKLRWDF